MSWEAIAPHLPALQVVIPMLAAPLCVLVGRPRATWAIAAVVSWVAFAIAIALLRQVQAEGVVSYEMGGWAAPWGIEYRVDLVNAFVLLIVSGTSAITVLFARLTRFRAAIASSSSSSGIS